MLSARLGRSFSAVAICEAIYCNCVPILPDRLNYPDLLTDELRGHMPLHARSPHCPVAASFARRYPDVDIAPLRAKIAEYDWRVMAPRYDAELLALASQSLIARRESAPLDLKCGSHHLPALSAFSKINSISSKGQARRCAGGLGFLPVNDSASASGGVFLICREQSHHATSLAQRKRESTRSRYSTTPTTVSLSRRAMTGLTAVQALSHLIRQPYRHIFGFVAAGQDQNRIVQTTDGGSDNLPTVEELVCDGFANAAARLRAQLIDGRCHGDSIFGDNPSLRFCHAPGKRQRRDRSLSL